MPVVWLVLLGILWTYQAEAACSPGPGANTWTAASAQQSELSACIAAAAANDTIRVPAGTGTDWTATLTITKCLTITGAGQTQTIIQDDVTTSSLSLLVIQPPANCIFRFSGFKFIYHSGGRASGALNGIVQLVGQSGGGTLDGRRIVFTDNTIDTSAAPYGGGTSIKAAKIYGVIARNTFLMQAGLTPTAIYSLQTTDYAYSDARWAESANFGGENFLFVEDNTFTHKAGSWGQATHDGEGSQRIVWRYNQMNRASITNHGTESVGRPRGHSVMEIYNNTYDCDNLSCTTLVSMRSATALIHDNTGINYPSAPPAATLVNFRNNWNSSPWGLADGFNPFDQNDSGNPLETHTVGSAGSLTVTVGGAETITGNRAGYIIRKTSGICNKPIESTSGSTLKVTGHGFVTGDRVWLNGYTGSVPAVMGPSLQVTVTDADHFTLNGFTFTTPGTGGYVSRNNSSDMNCSATISSNTSTTVNFSAKGSNSWTNLSFTAGDTFQINRVTQVLDQPGVLGGANFGGATYPVASNTQTVTPIYEWNNTTNRGDSNISVGTIYAQQIRANVHYFNNTVYTYTTYPHPHPLLGSDTTPPAAPTGVTISRAVP